MACVPGHRSLPAMAVRALCLAALVALAGCGHSRVVQREGARPSPPPPRSAPAPVRAAAAGEYVVRAGDTMYGIAFRHGLDYRELAALNRIPAPYTIYPGQRLRLQSAPAPVTGVAAAPTRPAPSVTGMPTPTVPAPAPASGVFETVPPAARPAPVAGPAGTPAAPPAAGPTAPAPAGAAPPPTTPSQIAAPTPTPATPAIPAPVPAATPVQPGPASAAGWRWPTRGQVISRFVAGDPSRQGLAIAGTAGQPVLAAGDGVVVYSGAGLVGYGELIIVKHSDEWLSAYAHNRRRLVAEGDAVKGGQQIAELGRTGTSRDMLHFEIRRNGKPVDPLPLLPPP